jgi:Flp pilus assembly protein TadG
MLTPLIFTLLFGMLEFGWSIHSKLSISNMALAGARTATTQGNDPLADYNVLQAVARASGGMPRSEIQYIVVYRASGPTDKVPATCAAGTSVAGAGVGSCNVYTAASINLTTSSFGGSAVNSNVDQYWGPPTRHVKAVDPPDYIGVYIKIFHNNLTKLFGSGYTFTDDTILRIEAQAF